jgi:hypothetical protein
MARPIVEPRTVTKNGKLMGRPRLEPPADAMQRVEELASEGKSLIGISKAFGISPDTLRRWFDDNEMLRVAVDWGRDAERYALHEMLRDQALNKGNAVASMFLLKSRHGYREGDQSQENGRVNITFNMPAAMTPEQFVNEARPQAVAISEPGSDDA